MYLLLDYCKSHSKREEIQECSDIAITAWIPEDLEPGVYTITATIDGTTFTSIGDENMEVEVKNRPVILSMSKTTMEDGAIVSIEGLQLLNPSNFEPHDPQVWIMKTGYSNSVSEITVDSEGKSAVVIIDEGIEPGEYNFLITTDEWSNTIIITII